MKTILRCFITLLLVLFISVMIPLGASAYENANNVIHVYYQPNYTSQSAGGYNLTVYLGGKATTLQQIGCNLFTYAHAIQWLEHTNYSTSSEYLGLLSQLVSVCNTPSASRNGYVSYMTNTLGFTKVSVSSTKEWLKNFFDQGGCIRTHIAWEKYGSDSGSSGHYFLAIGYTEKNGELYIQMLDSNPWSTVNRIECRSYSNPLTVTTDSSSSACQYWIPLSRFSKGYVVYITPAIKSQHRIQHSHC